MLKLFKMDIKLILRDKYGLFRWMILLIILYAFAIELDILKYILWFIPVIIVLSTTFQLDVKESVASLHAMIQSLPVKRWEYVISKYLLVVFKHGLIMIYTILVFKLLDILGFNSLEHINIVLSKEAIFAWFAGYGLLLPIMFIFFGSARGFFIWLISYFLMTRFATGKLGVGVLENFDTMGSILAILAFMGLSIWIAIFFYNLRDLGQED